LIAATKKLYPELDFEQTTAAERRELIKETNSEQTIFKGSELNRTFNGYS
jgi:hypothetical protein